jgi:hypothetical protein
MKRPVAGSALALCVSIALSAPGFAQGRGGGNRGAGAPAAPAVVIEPPYYMGCVAGGNLQPVEQPFVLEPAEPFVLVDVVTRTSTTAFAPTNYRVTGMNMTPWLGMRVKVEGQVVPAPAAGTATGTNALPEIKATRVSSIWGTCPSRPAWTPVPKP